jgi:drug/metabolite transporter (DMT)-like permease
MKKHLEAITLLALIVTIIFWASSFAGIRFGLLDYSPGHVALLRFLVASTVLGIYAIFTRMPLPRKKDIPSILFLGFIGISVYHVALTYGELTVTAGSASMIIALVPVFTAVLAYFVLRERLNRWGWIGLGISFIGVIFITIGEEDELSFDPGAFLILLSAIAAGIYFVFQKKFLKRYKPIQFASYGIWAGTLFMLVYLPGLFPAIDEAPFAATFSIIYLGVFPAALSYVTWAFALSRAPASLITSFLYVSPFLAILIAWVWLGEMPSALAIAGGIVVLSGVALVNLKGQGTHLLNGPRP